MNVNFPFTFALDFARGIPAIAVGVGGTAVGPDDPAGAAEAAAEAVAGRADPLADGAADAPVDGAAEGAVEAPVPPDDVEGAAEGAVDGAGVGRFEPHAARIGSAASPA